MELATDNKQNFKKDFQGFKNINIHLFIGKEKHFKAYLYLSLTLQMCDSKYF